MKKWMSLFLAAMLFTACSPTTKNEPETLPAMAEVPVQPEPEPEIHTARLSVVGDMMCHDYQYKEAYVSETGEYDFSHNFTDVKPYFAKSDLVIGNLETVFAGGDIGYSDFPLFNSPDAFLYAIKEAGFDLVTTANNHCLDKGEGGLDRTIGLLNDLGIDHVGTYRSAEEKESGRVVVREVNGIRIAVVAWSYGFNGNRVPNDYNVSLLTEESIRSDLEKAKVQKPDIIIALPHLGNEYETYTRDVFKNWVDIMFDAGADIVLASHPHVLQPMEYRTLKREDGSTETGFVIYSLGNFISSQTTPPRNASIILNLSLTKEGDVTKLTEVSFVPIWTQFRSAENINHFVVRSVYEMLTLPEEVQAKTLRAKDITRLKEIHYETTKALLNKEISLEDIQDEYLFPISNAS